MKKLIVLLHPKIGDMEQFKDAPNPPLNLLLISVYLHQEYDVKIVDQRIGKNWKQKLSVLLKNNPLCIGITCYSGPMICNAIEMSHFIRKYSSVPLIWGGIHPSILPEQTLKSDCVDIVVEGEGENAFSLLVEAIKDNKSLLGLPGVWFKSNGNIHHTPQNSFVDVNKTPEIPYQLINVENYISTYLGERTFSYLSSRGCPYKCTYCYNTVFNKNKWRSIYSAKVIDDINQLKIKHKISNIYFIDDNFFIDKKRAFTIIDGLKNLDVTWELQGVDLHSIQLMSEEELTFLENCGCKRITIGIESGTNRIRQLLKKEGDIGEITKQLSRLANKKFLVLCSLIIGFPWESIEEINSTIRFAVKILHIGNNMRMPRIYNFLPYPGTELFSKAVASGFTPPSSFEEWGQYQYEKQKVIKNKSLVIYMENISFISTFLDNKIDDYGTRWIFKLLFKLYRPVAWLRMRFNFFKFMPEKYIYNFLCFHSKINSFSHLP